MRSLRAAHQLRGQASYLRGQRHLPGWYWSATTGGHLVYESRLELARLLLADFDPEVVGIAAQPFLVQDADRRSHLIEVTDKGQALIRKCLPAWQKAQAEVSRRLGTGTISELRSALRKLSARN